MSTSLANAQRRVAESAVHSPEWCAAIEALEELERQAPNPRPGAADTRPPRCGLGSGWACGVSHPRARRQSAGPGPWRSIQRSGPSMGAKPNGV